MTQFIALIFAGFLANTAFASWIAPVSIISCTRDVNAWGHSDNCLCPHATRYERSLGQCVQGAPVEIAVDGVITTEPTLDGEALSFVLASNDKDNYELIMPRALKAHIEELEAQGLNFRVTGEVLENYDASEVIARPSIIVKSIEELATFRDAGPAQR